MAVMLGSTIVVSLGVSCQTAMQLDDHAVLMGALTGCEPIYRRTPFDWVGSPPEAMAEMFDTSCFFPADPAEIKVEQWPIWTRLRIQYLHEKGMRHDVSAARTRFERQGRRLIHMAESAQRRIFIVSNSQTNLADFEPQMGPGWFVFTPGRIKRLRAALTARFGASELHVVTRPDRHVLAPAPWLHVVDARPGFKEPKRGDPEAWAAILTDILSPAEVVKAA